MESNSHPAENDSNSLQTITPKGASPDKAKTAPCTQRLKTTEICLQVSPTSLPNKSRKSTHNPNGSNARSIHLNFLILYSSISLSFALQIVRLSIRTSFSGTLLGVSQMRVQSYNLFLKYPNHTKLLNINALQFWHAFCRLRTLA